MSFEKLTRQQLLSIVKWALYAVLFIVSILLETIVLPSMRIGGICLQAVPVCTACIALWEGAEGGGLFSLFASVFFALSGVDNGPLYVFTLTLSGIFCGGLCDHYCQKGFISSVVLSLLTLTFCLTVAFAFRFYLGNAAGIFLQTILLPEILLSVILVPLFYLGAQAIAKIGR